MGTLVVGCAASTAAADFVYTSQTRRVDASVQTNVTVFEDFDESNAVDVFNATATVSDGGATATTTIFSDLAPNKISMSGMISGLSDGIHVAGGRSRLLTTFTLPTEVNYTSVLNSVATNVPFTYLHSALGFAPIFNNSGTLPAGNYELSVLFNWNNSFGVGLNEQPYEFEFEITQNVPEPSSAVFGLIAIGGLATARRRRMPMLLARQC